VSSRGRSAREEFNFHARAKWESGYRDGCARGERGGEALLIRGVHRPEVVHIHQVHVALDSVVEREAGCRQYGCQVVEHAVRLLCDVSVNQLPGGGVNGRLAGAKEFVLLLLL